MGILFLMSKWSAPSELWMNRMIEALEPHVITIGAYRPTESLWRGRIPVINLAGSKPFFHRRILCSLGVPVWLKPRISGVTILKNTLENPLITTVFVNSMTLALEFEDVLATTKKSIFIHCHGYDVTWDIREHESPDQPVFDSNYLVRARGLSKKAIIIANSKFTEQRLLNAGIPGNRIKTKYFGIAVPDNCPAHSSRTDNLEIFYLGRLQDFKGPDLVIRAFDLACERGLDACLTIAGEGPLRTTCELLRRRSRFRERITMLGVIDESMGNAIRARADIFTAHNCIGPLSHQEEAFGVTVIEAMAAGLPVVTGRSGGVMETVVHGETGILVEPGDVHAHAEAFLKLAHNPTCRLSMGTAGWHRAKTHFSTEQERARLRSILGIEPI